MLPAYNNAQVMAYLIVIDSQKLKFDFEYIGSFVVIRLQVMAIELLPYGSQSDCNYWENSLVSEKNRATLLSCQDSY